jgi:hypothetical protein
MSAPDADCFIAAFSRVWRINEKLLERRLPDAP